ncbi:MAG: hypothetical protein RLZZ175_848 [Bacteroidota bacterium]|jgi:gliding motility-associated-like protein
MNKIKLVLLTFFLCIQNLVYAQITLNSSVDVSKAEVKSSEKFSYFLNFGLTSESEPGSNVIIIDTLPKHVKFIEVVNSLIVESSVYDTSSNELKIKLINPLPAGTTGTLEIICLFEPLNTPNNYTPINKIYCTADNANPKVVVSNTNGITSLATAPYTLHKEIVSYNSITKTIGYRTYLRYPEIGSCELFGYLNVYNQIIYDTIQNGGVFVSATNGGKETSPGSGIIEWDFTKNPFIHCDTNYYKKLESYVYISYPNSNFGDEIKNKTSFQGILPDNIPYQISSNETSYTLEDKIQKVSCSTYDYSAGFTTQLKIINDTTSGLYATFTNDGNVPLDTVLLELPLPDAVNAYGKIEGDTMLQPQLYYCSSKDSLTLIPLNYSIVKAKAYWTLPILQNGDFIYKVFIKYKNVQPGFQKIFKIPITVLANDRKGNVVVPAKQYADLMPCDGSGTCISFNQKMKSYFKGNRVDNTCTVSSMCRGIYPDVVLAIKGIYNNKAVIPGDTVTFYMSAWNVGDAILNMEYVDTLADIFTLVPNSAYSQYLSKSFPNGKAAFPTFSYNGQIFKANFSSDTNKFIDSEVYVIFKAVVKKGTAAGNYINKYYGVASNHPRVWSASYNLTINEVTNIVASKGVKGQIDDDYVYYPQTASTTNGSNVSYKIEINNQGNTGLKDLVIVDPLPFKNDYRNSVFSPYMTSLPNVNKSKVLIQYTLDSNFCITEVSPAFMPNNCITPTWSSNPPIDIKKIKGIKISMQDTLNGNDSLIVKWNMSAPNVLTSNQVAYNDFHYQAKKILDDQPLITTSPNKVGVTISALGQIGEYVWWDRNKNGIKDELVSEGFGNVKVELWKVGKDSLANTSDDLLQDSIHTNNTSNLGYYKFTVPANKYYIKYHVDTCKISETTKIGFTTSMFILKESQLKTDMNLGLKLDTVLIDGSNNICKNSQAKLTSTLTKQYSPPQYQWQKSIDNGKTWKNLLSDSLSSLTITKFTESDTGLYSVNVAKKGLLSNSCFLKSNSIKLQLLSQPKTPQYNNITVCEGEKVNLNKTTPNPDGEYFWYKTTIGGIPLKNNFTIDTLTNSTDYYLIDSVLAGCSSERTKVNISIDPKPSLPSFENLSVCINEKATLNKTSNTTNSKYYWYEKSVGGMPISNNFITNSLQTSTKYYLIDSISPTCKSARLEVDISIKNCLKDSVIFFPTGFTPNDDGVNDTYVVFNVPTGVTVDIWIYNRWGDLVHQAKNYQNDWRGLCTANNCLSEKLPSSTYFLVAKLSTGEEYKTSITLIR